MTAPIRPGGPCTCSAGREVRFVVPPVPGVPLGEVSCRPVGTAQWSTVRHHDLVRAGELPPALEVRVPGDPPAELDEYCPHMLGTSAGSCARCEGT